VRTAGLLRHRRVHLPPEQVGRWFRFADGTSARVYRDTTVDRGAVREPCVLVVEFQLRLVRGWGHALFRRESLLNTPLFAGFPGFVSKLWLTCDECGRYRSVYEWDGPRQARDYARALWRVLALVSVPGSIRYQVLPGLRRDDLPLALADPASWWCPVKVTSGSPGLRPDGNRTGPVRALTPLCARRARRDPLIARAPPGGTATDRATAHLGTAARAGAAGAPGRDDLAGTRPGRGPARPGRNELCPAHRGARRAPCPRGKQRPAARGTRVLRRPR